MDDNFDDDRPIRDQLLEARDKIIAQLNEMKFRTEAVTWADREGGGPPDYRSVRIELEWQLEEIEALLESHAP